MQGFLWRRRVLFLIFYLNNLQVFCLLPAESCSPEQSLALLHFKNSISTNSSASSHCDRYATSYPKTNSWKESTDCCSWDGVTCDRFTGNVIGLDLSYSQLLGIINDNSSLFLLRYLEKLNLACNDFSSEISSNFGWYKMLTHLNLSSSSFSGPIPPGIFHLSKLVSLDLSDDDFGGLQMDQLSFNNLLQNLTELRYLFLDSVNIDLVTPASLVNLSSSLISLGLRDTTLYGKFPTEVFHFPFLQWLSLSWNKHLTGNLPQSNWSSPLWFLDLYYTNFSGNFPATIGNLKHLKLLDLSDCNFKGSIPGSLWNLTEVIYLDLSFNGLTGQVPASVSNLVSVSSLNLRENNLNGQFPSSLFNLTNLSYLEISYNQLEGHFPDYVKGISNLMVLKLSNNFLNGTLPSWFFTLSSLEHLDLGYNKLTGSLHKFQLPGSVQYVNLQSNEIYGSIPNSVYGLVNLTFLHLSSNSLSGFLNLNMLSMLKKLYSVDLSHNNLLSLRSYGNVNFTMPALKSFRFSSCNLSKFPVFLSSLKTLEYLDLSNNKISGEISERDSELWHNMIYLNFSVNFLTSFEQIPSMQLKYLDLHSNLLQGRLMVLPDSVTFFSVSNNKLIGEIPSFFCNLSNINILDLSNNSLSGMIPQCLVNYKNLFVLDLRMNNFQGSVPQACAKDNALKTLNLNGNQLDGPLPASFVNCSSLEVLDVGNNRITDTFPHWLATLQRLQVLILRSNRFHGPIDDSRARFPFWMLRIVDISHNEFTGLLPTRYFDNFKAMMQEDVVQMEYMGDTYYRYSVILTMKGIDIKMERVLTIFTTIDLSNNQFQGEIPETVGKLNSLKVLNFSYNHLTDQIPLALENLTELESLDLSTNKLVGEIPMQLTNLKSLSVLNLSYNQLIGPIPHGLQFDTFQNNSYLGNLGLCGLPLSEKCDIPPNPILGEEFNNSSWFEFDWTIIMMGYISGLVIGLSTGYIIFSTRKPQWLVRRVERVQLKIIGMLKKCNGRRN